MCIFERKNTACFTGHRANKLKVNEEIIKELVEREIIAAIKDNIYVYLSGMAVGFDVIASETVIQLKQQFPYIKLVCALPYENFGDRRTEAERKRYYNILQNADKIIVVSEHYSTFCFQKRNIFMVDSSMKVISAYNGSKGGTQNTINYAKRKNVEVINIL